MISGSGTDTLRDQWFWEVVLGQALFGIVLVVLGGQSVVLGQTLFGIVLVVLGGQWFGDRHFWFGRL